MMNLLMSGKVCSSFCLYFHAIFFCVNFLNFLLQPFANSNNAQDCKAYQLEWVQNFWSWTLKKYGECLEEVGLRQALRMLHQSIWLEDSLRTLWALEPSYPHIFHTFWGTNYFVGEVSVLLGTYQADPTLYSHDTYLLPIGIVGSL